MNKLDLNKIGTERKQELCMVNSNSNSNCISIGIVRVRIPQQIAEKLAKTTVVITEGAREQPSKALSYSTQSTLVVTS